MKFNNTLTKFGQGGDKKLFEIGLIRSNSKSMGKDYNDSTLIIIFGNPISYT